MPCRGCLLLVLCHINLFAIDSINSLVVLCSFGKPSLFTMIALWWPDAYCLQKIKKLMRICNNIKICYSGNQIFHLEKSNHAEKYENVFF